MNVLPTPTTPAFRERFSPIDPIVEFSSIHQLVDGGVTDNAPVEQAVNLIGSETNIDTIFTLLAGRVPALRSNPSRLDNGREILTASFNQLWSSYQIHALRGTDHYFTLFKENCRSVIERRQLAIWWTEFARALGNEKLADIEKNIGLKPPVQQLERKEVPYAVTACERANWKQWDVWTFDPGRSEIEDLLAVDPTKIRRAFM